MGRCFTKSFCKSSSVTFLRSAVIRTCHTRHGTKRHGWRPGPVHAGLPRGARTFFGTKSVLHRPQLLIRKGSSAILAKRQAIRIVQFYICYICDFKLWCLQNAVFRSFSVFLQMGRHAGPGTMPFRRRRRNGVLGK